MDLFDTVTLNRVISSLKNPSSFLLDTFFATEERHESEFIAFDSEDRILRLTPFVAPTVAGKVVESQGYRAKQFKPPYLKDKRRFDPNRPLRRAPGEQIGGGTLSLMERRALAVRLDMEDQLRALTMRLEVMAASALLNGSVTVTGEGFGTQVVNFGRESDLTVILTGDVRWGESAADVVGNLETWGQGIQQESGSVATDVVMDPLAWSLARQNQAVKDALDTRRGSTSTAETGPLDGRKARNVGTIGDLNIWVYQEHYIDEAGSPAKVMPDYSVIMGSPADVEGVRAFAAIQDEANGMQAVPYFIKSWVQEDPSVRWLLLQSAPLVIPYRPNATLRATVHDGES